MSGVRTPADIDHGGAGRCALGRLCHSKESRSRSRGPREISGAGRIDFGPSSAFGVLLEGAQRRDAVAEPLERVRAGGKFAAYQRHLLAACNTSAAFQLLLW